MTRRTWLQKLRAWSRFIPMFIALKLADRRSRRPPFRRSMPQWEPGVSVLIPECGTPELLGLTLAHAVAAVAVLEEPAEIIVLVNGASPVLYQDLQHDFPSVIWHFKQAALGFNGAIEAGLKAVRYPAVYLLNSDMRIERDALQQLLPYRTTAAFALGSQIFFADAGRRREETGWADYYVQGTRTVVFEKMPDDSPVARATFYASGGSSLFRSDLLREYVRDSRGFSPFYWEDADWGVRAWEEGLECVFVPASKAVHEHRGTISRRFSAGEIARVLDRNALQFELRHHFTDVTGIRSMGHLAAQVPATRKELGSIAIAGGVAKVRGRSDANKHNGFNFADIYHKYYLPGWRRQLPTVLWVTPFAIYPPAHGGARRITELAKRLGTQVNLVLLTDEMSHYQQCDPLEFSAFRSVHLLRARIDLPDRGEQDLATRMQAHAPASLRYQLRLLQQQYQADLVQVEFMEATRLVEERRGHTPFVASLHDVYVEGGGEHDALQLEVLRHYEGVIACSDQDAKLLPGLPVHVIANGAVERYAHSTASPACKKVLFMGPFRYQPNYKGILEFLARVWTKLLARHPDAELVILGGPESAELQFRHPLLRHRSVHLVSEFVDPAPMLESCALTINPQQEIRGSALKVAESLLARRTCVSTAQGARGFDHLNAGALRICDSWNGMLDELDSLLGNQQLRHQLEQSSEELRNRLTWDGKATQLLALYRNLLPAKFSDKSEA